MKNKIELDQLEYFKLKASQEMLDRVMRYLDNNHFEIYKFICMKEISLIKIDLDKDINLLGRMEKR